MKITVLGGSGFIGSHVADELSKRGHQVKIFDKKKSKNYFLKLNDLNKRDDLLNDCLSKIN